MPRVRTKGGIHVETSQEILDRLGLSDGEIVDPATVSEIITLNKEVSDAQTKASSRRSGESPEADDPGSSGVVPEG